MALPRGCRYPDCEYCVFPDCKHDGLERADVYRQDKLDMSLEEVSVEDLKRMEYQNKYNQSEKGKASRKRYSRTEKGLENEKRKRQRKIDNGKNAEYCRRYYYKKKLQMQGA
jgi:hypothetical protein